MRRQLRHAPVESIERLMAQLSDLATDHHGCLDRDVVYVDVCGLLLE